MSRQTCAPPSDSSAAEIEQAAARAAAGAPWLAAALGGRVKTAPPARPRPRPGAYQTEQAARRAIDRLPADSQHKCVDCGALITDWLATPVRAGDGRWYIACDECAPPAPSFDDGE